MIPEWKCVGGRTQLEQHNCFYLKSERECKQWFVMREILDDLTRAKLLDEPRPCVWDPIDMSCGMQQFHCASYENPPPPPGQDASRAAVTPVHVTVPLHSVHLDGSVPTEQPLETSDGWAATLSRAGSRGWKIFMVNPAGVLVGSAALLSVAALVLLGICCYSTEVHLRDRIPRKLLGMRPQLEESGWEDDEESRSCRGRGKRGKKSRRQRDKIRMDHHDEEGMMLPVHELELDGEEGQSDYSYGSPDQATGGFLPESRKSRRPKDGRACGGGRS